MLKEKQKLWFYLIALGVVLLAVVGVIVWHGTRGKAPETPEATPYPTPQIIVRERTVEVEKEKLVEKVKEFTVAEISAGLNDMGFLLTQEYCFTDVITYSSMKKLFNAIDLGITESSYVATYDGVVTAGVDFTKLTLRKDEEKHELVVIMPAPEVKGVDIDPQSFRLVSEKTGLANPISIEDFNHSLVELEQGARQKALEPGLLEKADENARHIIEHFIAGFVDTSQYTIRFETAS